MPKAIVNYDPALIGAESLKGLLTKPLCEAIAEHLSCEDPNGGLKPWHVEVVYQPFGMYDQTNRYDVAVTILANRFPSREANLDERNVSITEAVREALGPGLVPGARGFIWTLLAPAAFDEFKIG